MHNKYVSSNSKNTEKVKLIYAYKQRWCLQKLSIAIMHTEVVICNFCIQKLSQLWGNFAIFWILIIVSNNFAF